MVSPVSKHDGESDFDRGFNIFSRDHSKILDSTSQAYIETSVRDNNEVDKALHVHSQSSQRIKFSKELNRNSCSLHTEAAQGRLL